MYPEMVKTGLSFQVRHFSSVFKPLHSPPAPAVPGKTRGCSSRDHAWCPPGCEGMAAEAPLAFETPYLVLGSLLENVRL